MLLPFWRIAKAACRFVSWWKLLILRSFRCIAKAGRRFLQYEKRSIVFPFWRIAKTACRFVSWCTCMLLAHRKSGVPIFITKNNGKWSIFCVRLDPLQKRRVDLWRIHVFQMFSMFFTSLTNGAFFCRSPNFFRLDHQKINIHIAIHQKCNFIKVQWISEK